MRNVGELNREYAKRAQSQGLLVQCLADGNINADIVIIAEAPGTREVEMHLPLVGGSGKLLWDCLRPHGIMRQHCYITNVVKKQLVDAVQGKQGLSKNELSHWRALLDWELGQLPNAKHYLLLGGVALEALVGDTGIDKWRGTVVSMGSGKSYVITYNPANIIRRPNLEPIFRLDCGKLDMVRKGTWRPHHITPLYDPTPKDAIQWCDKMIAEGKPVAYDIEVIGGETACVGFANDPHVGMCINFRGRSHNRWTVREELSVRRSIQRVLRHSSTRLVAQNGAFDAGWLWYKDRIKSKAIWHDTLLAHHTLHPTWPHNLGFLTAQYTTHPYYKDDGKEWREGGDISTFWEYNVKDVCITLAVSQALERELEQQRLADFFHTHVMRLQPWLINMTVLGNKVDEDERNATSMRMAAELQQLEAQFHEAVAKATGDGAYKPAPLSPKQLGELLFTKLRLVGRTTSTDDANRQAIISNPRTPPAAVEMLNALDRYKSEHKFFSTYVNAGIDDDGRIRSDYKQYGTQYVPGRLSSSATLWGSGMNLQNQPERSRGWFIADPGYCYVYFDGAQAEARIVGWEAPIPLWKEQFEQARLNPGTYDAHIALASEMFRVPYDQVTKQDYNPDGSLTLRGISKRCRHGLNYRMQPARLASVTGMSLHEAVSAYNAYHRATPELVRWWDDVINEVRTTRMLWTCLGRRIEFLGPRIDEELIDSIIAFKPQSTLGDFVCSVMYLSQEDDQWPRDARIVFNNHDSLTAMCRVKDAQRVASIMRKYAERPLIIKGDPLIIPSEFKISVPDERGIHRWSNLKKLKLEAA
jgi:uracil-DNA glycosylase family 4